MPGDTQVVHHTLVFAVQDAPSNGMPIMPGLSLGHYHPNGKTTVTDRTRVGIKFWQKGLAAPST